MHVDKRDLAIQKIKEKWRANKFEKDQKKINTFLDDARDWMVSLEKMLKGRLELSKIKNHHRKVLEMYVKPQMFGGPSNKFN